MPYKNLSRRKLLMSSGASGAAVYSPALGADGILALPDRIEDWTLEDRVYAWTKQQSRVNDGKVIWRTRGVIYAFKAPLSPIPLVRFMGSEQQWVKKIKLNEYVRYSSLLTYYCDFETGEIVDSFLNPITNEEVKVKPNWSRLPEGQLFSKKGTTLNIIDEAFPIFYNNSSIKDVEIKLVGDTVSFHSKMRWPEPLVRNPYNQDNTFFANLKDLQNISEPWIPSHGAGQILMPSMSSIGMNDPELGQVIWHVEFYKVKSLDDLPKAYLIKALQEHPDDFEVSPEGDISPSKLAKNLSRLGLLKK
mgnify:CR=1 FL=1